ncbi:MAG TPA: MOSC N-terminal beta barrel domain-containing protein [Bacteroidota bacterium]
MVAMIEVTQLNIYPIKSTAGISLDTAIIEERGFQYDRRWMLVDTDGRFMTQREHPLMALIRVGLMKNHLLVNASGMEPLVVPFDPAVRNTIPVVVWDDTVQASFVSRDTDEWFSGFLKFPCHLVQMTDTSERPVEQAFNPGKKQVSFADAFPFLLIGEESLADLNKRLPLHLPMNRFRPNIVVRGAGPFAEDSWMQIRIGDFLFHVAKPSARCKITTVDQDTAETGVEPLRTLATFRSYDNKVHFGQNMMAESGGEIKVGDRVEIINRKESNIEYSSPL